MRKIEDFENTESKVESAKSKLQLAEARHEERLAAVREHRAKQNRIERQLSEENQRLAKARRELGEKLLNGEDGSVHQHDIRDAGTRIEGLTSVLKLTSDAADKFERETVGASNEVGGAQNELRLAEGRDLMSRYAKAAGPLLKLSREIRASRLVNITSLCHGLLDERNARIGPYLLTESGHLVSAV